MPTDDTPAKGFLNRLVGLVKDQLISDVPDDIAVCEFDCRKPQCSTAEWATCERRLRKAAGELMPLRRAPSPERPARAA